MNAPMRTGFVVLLCLLTLAGFVPGALAQGEKPQADEPAPAVANPESPNAIPLPDSGSTTTSGTAWSITNNGGGRAGFYYQAHTSSAVPALEGRSDSTSTAAAALYGRATGANG